jgi:ABC-type amino acid transport substrate-binding protein
MMSTVHKSLTITFLAVSIFIAGLCADLVSAQSSAPEPIVTLTPEEQAWLKAHPDIKFGFTDAFEPFLIKGDNGRNSGILVDLLGLLNQRLRTQFELEIDPWSTMLETIFEKLRWIFVRC